MTLLRSAFIFSCLLRAANHPKYQLATVTLFNTMVSNGRHHHGLPRITAGIIVIGDEILNGSTADSNSHFMCKRLHSRGVLVKKISVIGDEVGEIAEEVKQFSRKFDFVFTTGGIGSTHDDRTFEGLAAAFDDELWPSDELRAVVEVFLRKTKLQNIDEAIDKFIRIPKSATLIWGAQEPPSLEDPQKLTNFPSIQVQNVIALPGVPRFCEQSFLQLEEHLFPLNPFYTRIIYLNRNEIHLQQKLTQIAENYASKGVAIGSYPVMGHNYYKTKLVIESGSQEFGTSAYEALVKEFSDHVINYDDSPAENSVQKMEQFLKSQPEEFRVKLADALRVIDQILDEFSLDKIALSFNGGKDCTILLHLLRVRVDARFGTQAPLNGFYILGDDEFPEVKEFVRTVSYKYNLRVHQLNGTLKAGLDQLKRERPEIVVVFMGSRSTDPRGRFMKSKREWTDADWPRFLRVCPVLDWSYADIWRAIRGLSIPYCSLYDEGYTSLGERHHTQKNPQLRIPNRDDKYYPAYQLKDGQYERIFRESRPIENSGEREK